MNPIPVTSCTITVVTAPPQGPATFGFQVAVTLQNGSKGQLRVETIEEFMAIAALLQVPGQLLFQPTGQVLIKNT